MAMKGGSALCFLQLALMVLAAASIFMTTPAAATALEGAGDQQKSPFVGRALLNSWGRTTSCTQNKTLCLDPTKSPAGPTCCAGSCTNIQTNVFNCGWCGHTCWNYYSCCGGKCVDTFNDSKNCGKCGYVCTKNKKGKVGQCSHGLCEYNSYGYGGGW